MAYRKYGSYGLMTGAITIVASILLILYVKYKANVSAVNEIKTNNSDKVKSPLKAPTKEKTTYSLDEANGMNFNEPLNLYLSKKYSENELFKREYAKFGVEIIDDINIILENGKQISFTKDEIDDRSVSFHYTESSNFPYESEKEVYLQSISFRTKNLGSHQKAMQKANNILKNLGLETNSLNKWFANRYGNNTLQNPIFNIYSQGKYIKSFTRYKEPIINRFQIKCGVDDENYENAIITIEVYFKTI